MSRAFLAALITTCLLTDAAAAGLDRVIQVQGRLDTSGGVPANDDYALTFKLFGAATGGAAVYTQGPAQVTVSGGLFDATLGPLPAGVLEVADALWLETTADGEVLPRQPMRAVPYALVAQAARVADKALDLACSGCVQDSDVGFPYAAAASKGGDATGLDCPGCVGSSDLAAGAIAATHLQNQAVSPAKVSFNYAGAASQGGPASDVECTGCVGSGDIAANVALAGNPTAVGSLTACTGGANGCGLKVGALGLIDTKDGALTIQAASGLRVRDATNAAWRPLSVGDVTAVGDLSVIGQAAVQGALTAAAVGAGTTTPGATLEVAGDALIGGPSRYLSFGTTVGAAGYGLRDSGGQMQVKSAGGAWTSVGETVPTVAVLSSAPDSPAPGTIYFDTTLGVLRVWTGSGWQSQGGSEEGCGATVASAADSCLAIRNACPQSTSGQYFVKAGGSAPIKVWCDMTSSGGGWMLLLSYDHGADTFPGSPNLLTTSYAAEDPRETQDYTRNWAAQVPNSFIQNGSSQIMLKRIGDNSNRVFTVKQWVGWSVPCKSWSLACGYSNFMDMYAIVTNFPFTHDYYFHACDGPECHNTNTYEAVGVDCHADYPANYPHTSSNTQVFAGSNRSNCPPGRDPDLWGFGATTPQQNRRGGWGFGSTDQVIGRVAFYLREAPRDSSGCGQSAADPGYSCKTIRNTTACGATANGVRWMTGGGPTAFPVWCDMETGPGGWTLLLSYNHKPDTIPGSPNLLAYNLNTQTPGESTDFARDWSGTLPNSFFINNQSEIMLKRMGTGATQRFTIKQWVGFNVTCNAWDSRCPYADRMSMYAIVKYGTYTHDYYFHACDGPNCHGTNTYEAVGVDCHADYTSNYGHGTSSTLVYAGGNQNNCPPGRDPDLWGFGATSPQGNRMGGWGTGSVNFDLGRVAYFFRE